MNNYGLGILIQAKDQASAVFQKVERNFDSLSKKSDELASRMQASSKTFYAGIGMMGAGATMLGGVAATIKVAGDFQEAMIGVQKTSGMTDAEIKKLGDRFVEMSSKMPNTAKELANIGEIGGQLGILGVENLSAFTDTVAKLASVSEFSAEEGGAALAKIANQFRIPIKQAKNMGSVLNELSNISTATAPTIAELTSRMAGAGSTIGLTMPQISAISAALTDMGVNSEVGGTAMSDMFMEMLKRTEEYAQVAGMSTAEFKRLMEKDALGAIMKFTQGLQGMDKFKVAKLLGDLGIGGARGTDVLLKLVEATRSFNGQQSLLGKFVNVSNKAFTEGTSLQREYDNSLKGMNAQLKVAWNSVISLAIGIGQQMVPYVTKAAKAISSFVRGIVKWGKEHPGALRGIVLLVAALGGLLFVGGAILTFLGALGMLSVGLASLPMAAGALGGVVAAIWPIITIVAAVIAIGYLLYKAWTTNFMGIRDIVLPILQALKAGFSSFMKAHGDTVMAFVNVAGKIVFAVLAVAGAIRIVKGVISTATTVWRTGAMAVRFLYFSFQMARAYASYYGQAILSAMRNTLAFARTAVASAVQGLKRFAISLASAVRQAALFAVSLARQAVAAVASFATSLVTGAVTAIGSFAAALVPAIAGAWAFTAALLANPITWIVLAIIALIVIIILLVKNWDKVKAVVIRVWNIVVEWIKGAVAKIKTFFIGIYQAVVDAFSRAWAWLKAFIIKWWPFILGVCTGGIGLLIGLIIQNWGKIMAFLQGIGMAISNWITGVVNWIRMRWDALKMAVIMIWQSIQNAISWVINTVRNIVSGVIMTIQFRWQQFRSVVAGVWNSISATVSGVIAGIQSRVQAVITFITGLWNGLKTAVAGVWNWIVEKISGAIATIKNKLLGLIPGWLRTTLSYIGINIPAPSKKGEAYATGGYVAKTGGISATLHEGEVITPAPAVQKIVRFADMIPASGIAHTQPTAPAATTVHNHISISLPNVKEIDRQSVEELANLIIKKIEYLQKRKREAGFSNDFNPGLAVAKV